MATIIGTLPNTISNGQLADAVPVMNDLNFIVNQVNANAAPTVSPALSGTPTAPTAAAGTNSTQVATTAFVYSSVPAGVMFDFGGTAVPPGFLACDGSAVDRTTFAALFAAIGTTWGAGNGSTTFNVPNMQRRTAIGSGGGGTGVIGSAVGNTGGEESHALTIPELASHNHTDSGHVHVDSGHVHVQNVNTYFNAGGGTTVSSPGGVNITSPGGVTTQSASANIQSSNANIQNTGSGTAHNTMQPSAVVLKIIKT